MAWDKNRDTRASPEGGSKLDGFRDFRLGDKVSARHLSLWCAFLQAAQNDDRHDYDHGTAVITLVIMVVTIVMLLMMIIIRLVPHHQMTSNAYI